MQPDELFSAGTQLLTSRFPDQEAGAAAMLLSDGRIVTGTAPEAFNAAVEVCHEMEPYCAAHRLGLEIVASLCVCRIEQGKFVVLAPCGVCQERLATYGPDVLVAVSGTSADDVQWRRLSELMPYYRLTSFPDSPTEWKAIRF